MARNKAMNGQKHGHASAKPVNVKATTKKLLKYLKPHLPLFIVVLVIASLGAVANIVAPKISAKAINALQEGIMRGSVDMTYIIQIVAVTAALYVMSALFEFTAYLISAIISQKIVYKMRLQVKEKLKKLPISYYDNHSHGNILSIITNDIETISNSLQQGITQSITGALSIIVIFAMMLSINGLMTLITVASIPLFLIITMVIAKQSQKKFVERQAQLGELNGYIEEIYTNKKVVQLYGEEENTVEKFSKVNEKLFKSGRSAESLSGMIMPSLRFVSNLSYVATSILGGALAGGGKLMIGDISAFIQYSNQFGQPIMQTANIVNVFQSTLAAAERLFNLLEQDDEPEDVENPANVSDIKGKVAFKDVCFSYDKEKELIKDVNLEVEAGGIIAIVGPTGAGKTTLVNLLMRFYEIDSGSITIDGIDIRDMAKTDLRKLFGMVLQDTWLESGSIKDNIAYGKPDATFEEIQEAAKKAHIDHYIDTLPDGYDTEFNDEVSNVSQGQRQLFTIARAILADTKILILDEATSSVDTKTESYIQNAMTAMMKGKTSFIIAHRLSTIRSASLILVMDKGRIVEQGTHDELLEKGGFYYTLYNNQFVAQNV